MPNKKSNTPKRKTLNRTGRLLVGKAWISIYRGKNLTRGYAKHYGVDLLCAIVELRMLGVPVSAVYEEDIKKSIAARAKLKQKTRESYGMPDDLIDWEDVDMAFPAGYVDQDTPFGVRWEELETTGSARQHKKSR